MLVRIENLIINTDHIVDIQYFPEHVVAGDFDGDEPYTVKARIKIQTTASVIDTVDGYDGRVDGVASVSDCWQFDGEKASIVWEFLSRDALTISI